MKAILHLMLPVSALAICACGSDPERWTSWGWGAGDVCFDQDEPSVVKMVFEECLLDCAEVESTFCEATLEGNRIYVSGFGEAMTYPERECDDVCVEVTATCEIKQELQPGTYTVIHHDIEAELELPADDCLEL